MTLKRKLGIAAVLVVLAVGLLYREPNPPITAAFVRELDDGNGFIQIQITNRSELVQHYACWSTAQRSALAYGFLPAKLGMRLRIPLPDNYPTGRTTRIEISGYKQPAGLELSFLRLKHKITGIGIPRTSWKIWVAVPPTHRAIPRLLNKPVAPPLDERDALPLDVFAPFPPSPNPPLP